MIHFSQHTKIKILDNSTCWLFLLNIQKFSWFIWQNNPQHASSSQHKDQQTLPLIFLPATHALFLKTSYRRAAAFCPAQLQRCIRMTAQRAVTTRTVTLQENILPYKTNQDQFINLLTSFDQSAAAQERGKTKTNQQTKKTHTLLAQQSHT